MKPYRDVTLHMRADGRIAVGVYDVTGSRISGTLFHSWPPILKFLNRLEDYQSRIFVRFVD
jgi:hypothetical protein